MNNFEFDELRKITISRNTLRTKSKKNAKIRLIIYIYSV